MGDYMKEKKLRDAYARCYYQQGGFPHKALEDMTAAVMLTKEELMEYRRGLSPYSQVQIKNHVRDFEIARVIAVDAYVSGAAMVEAIHGADMMVLVGSGYSTLSTRLLASRLSRYEIYDVEAEEVLEDKYRRIGSLGEDVDGIKRVLLEDGFLEKIRFTKKCFCDLTGIDDLELVKKLGEKLSYDSAVVFVYRGEYGRLEKDLSDWGFRIYEYSTGKELEERFFGRANLMSSQYNLRVPKEMNIVLAVKKP